MRIHVGTVAHPERLAQCVNEPRGCVGLCGSWFFELRGVVARLPQITPMVPVADIGRSVAFFENVLGFSATFRMDGYA